MMFAQTPAPVYVTNPGVVSYPGIPQQQPYYQMMRQPQFQPQAAYQQSTMYNQNQGQTIFTPAQKQPQQTQQPQLPSQQQPKGEKKALLTINPDTNLPIAAESTAKAPSKSPEPEPDLPIISPTTDAKREFQQKIIGKASKTSSAASTEDSHPAPEPLLQPSAGPPPMGQPTPLAQFPPPEPPQQHLQGIQQPPQPAQPTQPTQQPTQPTQPTQQPLQSTQSLVPPIAIKEDSQPGLGPVLQLSAAPPPIAQPTHPFLSRTVTQDEPLPEEQSQEKTVKEDKLVKVEENWQEDQTQELWRREEPSKEDHEEEKEEGEISDCDDGSDEPKERTYPPLMQQGKMEVAISLLILHTLWCTCSGISGYRIF